MHNVHIVYNLKNRSTKIKLDEISNTIKVIYLDNNFFETF